MRIVYLFTTLGIGGAEKQVISLAERMAARGHVVSLLVLKYSGAEEWPTKLPVMRLNLTKTPYNIMRGLRFAAGFLKLFKPDIVHSHTFPGNVFARLLRFFGLGCVVVNTIHNVYEGGWHRMMIYRCTDWLADAVTAVSAAAMDRFAESGAVRGKKLSLITNGIEVDAFSADKQRRKRIRRLMGARHEFVWLALGRLVAAKDYPNLLRAFAMLRKKHPESQLWIAGEGEAAKLELEEGLQAGVEFLGLSRDVAGMLDAADGFVLSSAWEGMPLALGEAMVMEKAVVATDVGGVRELVGDAGKIVAARDSVALADAMLEVMLMSVNERIRIGRMARMRVEQLFSMDAKAAEWEERYAQWLQRELT